LTATRSQKLTPSDENPRRIASALNRVIEGRTDNYGSVTLRAGETTTTVTDQNASENSTIVLSPRTANAAAALATTYVGSKLNKSFVLTHASNSQTDKTFDYAVIG
jgi:hypothetical protein